MGDADQSLRDALEKVLATTDGWAVSNETLLGLLAAHPAEPASVAPDWGPDWDQEKYEAAVAKGMPRLPGDAPAAAPLLGTRLARPTREQIADALVRHYPKTGMVVASGVTCECGYWNGVESPGNDRPAGAQGRDGLNWHRAQVVLALLNGVES